jgi:hypothetical protein
MIAVCLRARESTPKRSMRAFAEVFYAEIGETTLLACAFTSKVTANRAPNKRADVVRGTALYEDDAGWRAGLLLQPSSDLSPAPTD